MTREALKKLNEKQMNYCKTLSALIDRAKIKGLKDDEPIERCKRCIACTSFDWDEEKERLKL